LFYWKACGEAALDRAALLWREAPMRHSLLIGFSFLALCAASPPPTALAQNAVQDIHQGDGWTPATRADF
jgi:hypothetical protein